MEELLKKLIESDLLTEDVKQDITEAFAAKQKEIEEDTRARVEAEVTATLTEQFVADKEALVEAVDSKVEEFLNAELVELKEDIERFRDLEAEFADKEVALREEYANKLETELTTLVETIDSFLDVALTEEFEELRESIEEVKKVEFGRTIFETFANIFHTEFNDDEGIREQLAEAKQKAEELEKKLNENAKSLNTIKRDAKMKDVLSSLHGRSREVMEAILKSVPTDKLEEAYERYIPRVLNESAKTDDKSEKETASKDEKVLAEGNEVVTEATKVVTGDAKTTEGKESEAPVLSESAQRNIAKLRKLAGI